MPPQEDVPTLAERMRRTIIFRRAMKRFLRSPELSLRDSTLMHLVYGWGNELWSAWIEYLTACVEHALTASGPILECGSGLSTILVAVVATRRRVPHWALEHVPEWAARVELNLKRYRLDSVIDVAPLRDYGEFVWYAPSLERMPDSFGTVICDGPPGSVKGGRFGLVPIMSTRLSPGCVILLDDAYRTREKEIANIWSARLGAPIEMLGHVKPFIRMTLPSDISPRDLSG